MAPQNTRRQMQGQTKNRPWYRWLIVTMTMALIVASLLGFQAAHHPAAGQLPLHQWLGLIVVGGMVGHLMLHGERILRSLTRPFATPARLDRILDLVLTLLVLAVLVSGFALGGLLGGELERAQPWQGLHHLTSKLLILLGGWHIIRHRRWFLASFRRARPAQPPAGAVGTDSC